jgi:hypothetical protein
MDTVIEELSKALHELYEQIMKTDPWEDGYGEVVAIHESLSRVLRDKAQTSMADFQGYLRQAASDIEQEWTTNKSHLQGWTAFLKPVFEKVEVIIDHAVPLLALVSA